MKLYFKLIFLLIILSACTQTIKYQPNITREIDPLVTIKNTIERQSPGYQLVQSAEVTEDYLKVGQMETSFGAFLHQTQYLITRIIYWENVKEVKIQKRNYLWMEVMDNTDTSILLVYPRDEAHAKLFVDAVAIMTARAGAKSQKK